MDPIHIHLVLNHVAVLAALFSIIILVVGMILRNKTLRVTALVGFVVAVLAALPVFFTGETAEHAIEEIAGVSHATIELHEEAAAYSIWLIAITGIISLIMLIFHKNSFFNTIAFTGAFLMLAIVTGGALAYTGFLGGEIRHSEIAAGASANDIDTENIKIEYDNDEHDD